MGKYPPTLTIILLFVAVNAALGQPEAGEQECIETIKQGLSTGAIDTAIERARANALKYELRPLSPEAFDALRCFLTNVAKQLLQAHEEAPGVAEDFPHTVIEVFRIRGYAKTEFRFFAKVLLFEFLDLVNHTFTERQIRLMTPAEFAQLYFVLSHKRVS